MKDCGSYLWSLDILQRLYKVFAWIEQELLNYKLFIVKKIPNLDFDLLKIIFLFIYLLFKFDLFIIIIIQIQLHFCNTFVWLPHKYIIIWWDTLKSTTVFISVCICIISAKRKI